jgi:hypothetical protein
MKPKKGSPFANYDIGWSNPDRAGHGCALEKFIVSGGPGFLTMGAEFSLGRKDKSPMINRQTSYFDSLNSLSSSPIIFYDVHDHRAWLSNGLHALLHLVRASLKYDSDSDLAEECLLKLSDLVEDSDPSNPKAALKFLRNRTNLELAIFANPDEIRTEEVTVFGQPSSTTHHRVSTSTRVKDRVEQLMYVLEQLIDCQVRLDTFPSGVPLRLTPREKLEGYRFMDMAARRPLSPRVTHLRSFGGAGKSWVDFSRAIKAVTLFGEGFGELISPSTNLLEACPYWGALPSGRDFLAASGYDLIRIQRQEGSVSIASNTIELARGIFWQKRPETVGPCFCLKRRMTSDAHWHKPCNRVQVLLPRSMLFLQSSKMPEPICAEAGFVFGRSEVIPWRWPDEGDPTPDRPLSAYSETACTDPLSSDLTSTAPPDSSASATTTATPLTGLSTVDSQNRGRSSLLVPSVPQPKIHPEKSLWRRKVRGISKSINWQTGKR